MGEVCAMQRRQQLELRAVLLLQRALEVVLEPRGVAAVAAAVAVSKMLVEPRPLLQEPMALLHEPMAWQRVPAAWQRVPAAWVCGQGVAGLA